MLSIFGFPNVRVPKSSAVTRRYCVCLTGNDKERIKRFLE